MKDHFEEGVPHVAGLRNHVFLFFLGNCTLVYLQLRASLSGTCYGHTIISCGQRVAFWSFFAARIHFSFPEHKCIHFVHSRLLGDTMILGCNQCFVYPRLLRDTVMLVDKKCFLFGQNRFCPPVVALVVLIVVVMSNSSSTRRIRQHVQHSYRVLDVA